MAAPKLFAREIAAYDDEELDRYLEENGRHVRVHDPENLPRSFIQRLRERVHSTNDDIQSRPVDLDQVSARLLQASASIEALREFLSHQSNSQDLSTLTSSGSETPEDPYLQALRYEREYHDELVKDGGRPWYPIHRLEEISKHPEKHRELLRYWQGAIGGNPDEWLVFGGQVLPWRWFREWQAKRREEFKGRMAEYTGWARKFLLNRHSYTAPVDFAFEEDPKRQDQLTTWIEYLAYECNFCTKRFEWHQRRKRWYDIQWKKLADAGVLRSHETEEFIWNPESGFQRTSEEVQAETAVESARLAVRSAEQAIGDSLHPPPRAQRRLEAAKSKLDSAVQSFESIRRGNDLISEFLRNTRNYKDAMRNAERHAILLHWVKEQVSLIEVEPKQGKAAEDNSGARRGKSQGIKRVGADENTETEGHGNKRRKQDDEERAAPRP